MKKDDPVMDYTKLRYETLGNEKQLVRDLVKFSKEDLITIIRNHESIENKLREKLFLLTGCKIFGDQDGMCGSCIDCSYEHDEQFKRCYIFRLAMAEYEKRKGDDWKF